MRRDIRITAIRNPNPDIRLYVLALIALARQLQEEGATRPPAPQQVLEKRT